MEIEVVSRERRAHFHAQPGERLLHAGLRAGCGLRYECASGTCGSCRARLVSGETQDLWPDAPGRRLLAVESGEILMCQHAARADCRLEVRGALREAAAGWPLPREFDGVVERAEPLASDVMRLEVELDIPCRFVAGQFMLVGTAGLEGPRAYSMVNAAGQVRRFEFVLRRKPGGAFSGRIFGQSPVGLALKLFGPLGFATFSPGLDRHLLCIAGGTGIAGLMSVMSTAAQSGHFRHHDARLFFGVRSVRDAFFLHEFERIAAAFPGRVEITVALSDERAVPAELCAAHSALRFELGLVHDVAARAMAGRYQDVRAFLAGPPAAVEAALKVLLMEAGLPTSEIRYDKFG